MITIIMLVEVFHSCFDDSSDLIFKKFPTNYYIGFVNFFLVQNGSAYKIKNKFFVYITNPSFAI